MRSSTCCRPAASRWPDPGGTAYETLVFSLFLQTIRIHYQDPELALYTKGVIGLLWLVQLPVALWYGAPAQFYALLGAMLLAIGVDLVPFPANTAARTITLPLP